MDFMKFKMIMKDCHIDDPKYITEEYLLQIFDDFGLKEYPNNIPYLCLATPPINDKTMVMVFWVDPTVRRKGIATKLIAQLPIPHEMVVDYRSEEMHKLLESLNYKSKTSYMIDDKSLNLYGGDKLYYKE